MIGKMGKEEWVVIFAMLLIEVIFIIGSLRLGLGSFRRPGAGFLPFLTGAAFSLVVLFLVIRTFLTTRREREEEGKKSFDRSVLKVFAIVVALTVYVLTVSRLGYLLSTFLLLIFLFKTGGFRKWTSILMTAFITLSISYLLFSHWLNIRFPKGFLGF